MAPVTAFRMGISKYTTFSGRASRSEFWYWVLAVVLLAIIVALIDAMIIVPALGLDPYDPSSSQPLSALLGIVLFLPGLAMVVRRLHDIGKSGWWVLISLIPLLGILVLIYFYIQPSEGPNDYGPPEPFPG